MIQVSVTRAGLSLPPLVIAGDGVAAGLWVDHKGLGEPAWDYRRTYAPESNWIAGRRLLAAVRDASEIPLAVFARAATGPALTAQRALFDAAVGQWDYDLTITVDGVATTYRCEPAIPVWGQPDASMVRKRVRRATVSIPVN